MRQILFISDIHLSQNSPEITAEFFSLLERAKTLDLDALFILGDLFDFWIGDKAADAFALEVAAKIAELGEIIPIFFQRGNRDFLLGRDFCIRSQMLLLPDIFVFEYQGKKLLLEHGDLLCTQDKSYQRMRAILRSRCFYLLAELAPRALSLWVAKFLRSKSKQANRKKSSYQLQTVKSSVERHLAITGAAILIHGHTHCPDVQQLEGNRLLVVLGDWNPMGKILEIGANQTALVSSGDLGKN